MAGVLDDGALGAEPTGMKPVGLISSGQEVLGSPQPTMRKFDDVAATRDAIFGGIKAAASSIQPLTNQRHTLSVSDVDWDDVDTVKPIKAQRSEEHTSEL